MNRGASSTSPPLPSPAVLRWVGPAAKHRNGRYGKLLGARADDAADMAYAVALGPEDASTIDAVVRTLPSPTELPKGALLVIVGEVVAPPSLVDKLRRAVGRAPVVPRAVRSTALLLRGYVGLGASFDEHARADVSWAYVP